jgi:hypothetical protein
MGCGCGTKRPTDVYMSDVGQQELTTLERPKSVLEQKPDAEQGSVQKPELVQKASEVTSATQVAKESKTVLTRNMETTNLSGLGPTFEDSKCLQCEDSNNTLHMLECSHGLCPNCAKQQIEAMLLRKHGLIEFMCKSCKAPKALSNSSRHRVEVVLLACGCREEVLGLDRSIRGAGSPDKILVYDLVSNGKNGQTNRRHPQPNVWGKASFDTS